MNWFRTDSASFTFLSVLVDLLGETMSLPGRLFVRVACCGSRQLLTHGGNHERRILRSPSGDHLTLSRSLGRTRLSGAGTLTGVVSLLVAALSSAGPRRAVRSHTDESSSATDCARTRTHHCVHPAAARIATASAHALQSHRGQRHSSRTQGVAHSPLALRAHHRTGTPTQRDYLAPRAFSALRGGRGLPSCARPRLQSTPSGRPRRAALPERQTATLLHLRVQGCVRWRGLPEIEPFAQDGRRADLSGRVLEDPGTPRADAVRQCARVPRLGTCGTLPLARHSPVPGPGRDPGLHPTRASATQWQRRELQRLVSTPSASAALLPTGRAHPRTSTLAGDGQPPPCPSALGWVDDRSVSPPAQIAAAAAALHDPHRTVATGRRARDLHPPGDAARQGLLAWPDLQSRQTPQGPISQARVGYATPPLDRLCEGACVQALALCVFEVLTDIPG